MFLTLNPLYTTDEVSREHLRLRRDPGKGEFRLTDLSRNGTWLNGRRIAGNVEIVLPERAELSLAEKLNLTFEVRHD